MQRPREDHLGTRRLEPDDRAPLIGGSSPVELDLAVDLLAVEHRALYDLGVVRGELVPDGGEIRDGAAHADESVRARASVEACQVDRDRLSSAPRASSSETAPSRPKRAVYRAAPTSTLKRSSTRVRPAERELGAAAAGVEHDEPPVPSSSSDVAAM